MATAQAYPQVGHRGTGRRKEAVARVRLVPGKGNVIINGKDMSEYMGRRKILEAMILRPMVVAGVQENYTILANVYGGGQSGQADAIRLGVARALSEISDDHEQALRAEKLLTRNALVKERKKYGRKRARKRFQFSKR